MTAGPMSSAESSTWSAISTLNAPPPGRDPTGTEGDDTLTESGGADPQAAGRKLQEPLARSRSPSTTAARSGAPASPPGRSRPMSGGSADHGVSAGSDGRPPRTRSGARVVPGPIA